MTDSRCRSRLATCLLTFAVALYATDRAYAQDPIPPDSAMRALDQFILANPVDRRARDWRTRLRKPPKVRFDPGKKYVWKLVTNQGELRIAMRPDVAPMHVSSTFYLTRLGFYDSLGFHRVVTGFMAQGGDPLGNGRGDPGFSYGGEIDRSATHDRRGILSMANAGPSTDGSQFFLTFRATPELDGRHTVFGVVEGQESFATLDRIEALGRARDPAPPKSPVVIERATILVY